MLLNTILLSLSRHRTRKSAILLSKSPLTTTSIELLPGRQSSYLTLESPISRPGAISISAGFPLVASQRDCAWSRNSFVWVSVISSSSFGRSFTISAAASKGVCRTSSEASLSSAGLSFDPFELPEQAVIKPVRAKQDTAARRILNFFIMILVYD